MRVCGVLSVLLYHLFIGLHFGSKKNRENIDSFLGFIETFSRLSNRSEALVVFSVLQIFTLTVSYHG